MIPLETIVLAIGSLLASCVLGLMAWMIRQGFSRSIERLDRIEASQHACQLRNVETFATKVDLKDLDARLDDHDCRIGRLEGGR